MKNKKLQTGLEIFFFFFILVLISHTVSPLELIVQTYATCGSGSCYIKGTVKNQGGGGVSGEKITIGGQQFTTNSSGDYLGLGLNPGSYTVKYNGPPSGNTMVYPTNNPPSWNVKVGNPCNTGGAPGQVNCDQQGNISELDFQFKPGVSNCTTNITCGVCGGASANTCSNNGTKSCTYTGPAPCNQVPAPDQTCSIDNCAANNTCSNGACVPITFTILGNIFTDYDNDGINNNSDANYANKTVTVTAKQTSGSNVGSTYSDTTTDASGNYSIANVPTGTYTITLSVPVNMQATTTNPFTNIVVSNANITGKNFGITPLYTIGGVLYNDVDGSQTYNAGDSKYAGNGTITITGLSTGTVTKTINFSGGTYISPVLLTPGTYQVSYTTLPSGYFMTYIQNGPPPTFTNLVVGTPTKTPSCFTNNYLSAGCDASGNIINLNFGISNVKPWIQSYCGDMRFDGGYDNPVPASPVCGGTTLPAYQLATNATCSTHSGVYFSGSTSSTFGSTGKPSSTNWYAGGNVSNPESFTPVNPGVMRTSYNYLIATAKQSGITPTDVTTISGCSLASCSLPNNTTTFPHGLYQANGTLHLKGFTVPPGNAYVLVVKGDLYIEGSIIMPSTANASFIVSASGNIYIDSTVGQTATDPTATLAGLYSADNSFIIQPATGSCSTGKSDKRINIEGTVIVNAGLQQPSPGTFQNNRDLCIQNSHCPTVTITQRPDLLVNMPVFVKHTNSLFQEVAP